MYAIDLEAARLARVSATVPLDPDRGRFRRPRPGDLRTGRSTRSSRRWSWSTSLTRTPTSRRSAGSCERSGRAYVTTVFKKPWAWYFRRRDGESVLDTSHLREYTDLPAFRALVEESGMRIVALERNRLWFPLLDPVLFRAGGQLRSRPRLLRVLRAVKVPIPGYFALEVVVER